MSKASKLARMRNTVLETTGLTYNTSGQTVELNFTPNVTTPGVSVPLVLAGNTNSGVCSAPDFPPLLGYPYAHIRDSKPGSTFSGIFFDFADGTQTGNFLIPGLDSTSLQFRSRTYNERVVDEIGISVTPATSSDDSGGPGVFLNFPTGTYYISCLTPTYEVNRNIVYLVNYTKAKPLSVSQRTNFMLLTSSSEFSPGSHQSVNTMNGRFSVTDSNDNYIIAHGCQDRGNSRGFGVETNTGSFKVTESVFSSFEIWKIG